MLQITLYLKKKFTLIIFLNNNNFFHMKTLKFEIHEKVVKKGNLLIYSMCITHLIMINNQELRKHTISNVKGKNQKMACIIFKIISLQICIFFLCGCIDKSNGPSATTVSFFFHRCFATVI